MNTSFFNQAYKARKVSVFHDVSTNIRVDMLREDEIHPLISGNKFRKLKYNLMHAKAMGFSKVLSFGGAYSNHIVALACACKMLELECVGVVRGDELALFSEEKLKENPSLKMAIEHGMQLKFISRDAYRNKNNSDFLEELRIEFGDFYNIPEGGTNALAVKGCKEILGEEDSVYDFICVPVGTGGTMAGLVEGSNRKQHVLGFSALASDYLTKEVSALTSKFNWDIRYDFHFGGYAKVTDDLVAFMNSFYASSGVLLDPIYTAKMMFGVVELIKFNFFPKNTRILAIHTGGLQGIDACNALRIKKGASIIHKVNV